MPRLFTALEIPRNAAMSLSLLRGGLPGARWIDVENYHITLRFIGDVDDAQPRSQTHVGGVAVDLDRAHQVSPPVRERASLHALVPEQKKLGTDESWVREQGPIVSNESDAQKQHDQGDPTKLAPWGFLHDQSVILPNAADEVFTTTSRR